MNRKNVNKLSRLVVAALRHHPEILEIQLDSAGYCSKMELRKALNNKGYEISMDDLEAIINNERFGIDKTGQKVRVDYGNSLGMRLEDMYEYADVPPEILYHGTSADALESIKQKGVLRFAQNGKKARDHIFLTEWSGIAIKKGARYGRGVALPIMAREMQEKGFLFYHVKNDIWLTDHIPPEYIDYKNLIFS